MMARKLTVEDRWRARHFMLFGLMLGAIWGPWLIRVKLAFAIVVPCLFFGWIYTSYRLNQLEESSVTNTTEEEGQ